MVLGWRIKQFIAHRRNSSLEDYSETAQDNILDKDGIKLKFASNQPNGASWVSQSPGLEPLQRANSSAATRRRNSPPTNMTAHSSASSLCSCECTCSSDPGPGGPLFDTSAQRMEPRGEILYLPPAPTTSTGDAKTWRLIFPEDQTQPGAAILGSGERTSKGATNVRSSTFGLLEALTIEPVDENRTPTQSIRNMQESNEELVSENVEQLIRETDEAFKAVGNALADARAVTAWHDDLLPQSRMDSASISRGLLQRETRPLPMPRKAPITRARIVTKGKQKAFYKRKPSPFKVPLRDVPPPPVNTPSRWTLTDMTSNMADIFHGRLFRTEVDEMLTPDRLQRMRDEEKNELERRISTESTRSSETGASTPTEPFHLEDLSSRITAAQLKHGKKSSFSSPILSALRTPPRGSSLNKAWGTEALDDPGMDFQESNFPSPPKRLTRSSTRSAPAQLPTIDEISPLTFRPRRPDPSKGKPKHESLDTIEPRPDFILLQSTPCTLTSPLFQHGPIRIERKQKEVLVEDELDWTAFQMAISGHMDEIGVDERDDIEWAADEDQVDDILDWWAGYRFPHYGRIISAPALSRTQKRKAELVALKTRIEGPRAVSGIENIAPDSGTDKIAVEPRTQAAAVRWMKTGHAESMPPSPMFEFPRRSTGKVEDVVPMGYNLGHDLGDFLDWETHYVRKYYANG